jgi:hypothetical protein
MGRLRRRARSHAARGRVATSHPAQRVVARETATKRAATAGLPRADAPGDIGWHGDPALAVQLEEVLATLTLKRRRFLLNYLDSGNATKSALAAGYNCKDARSASDVGREILAAPAVQHAYQALMEASGLSTAKLTQVHALHLSRHSSPDGGDRDRSLRATALAYKYLRPPPAPAGTKPFLDQLLDEMTPDELRHLAASGLWPVRFAARLGDPRSADSPTARSTGDAGRARASSVGEAEHRRARSSRQEPACHGDEGIGEKQADERTPDSEGPGWPKGAPGQTLGSPTASPGPESGAHPIRPGSPPEPRRRVASGRFEAAHQASGAVAREQACAPPKSRSEMLAKQLAQDLSALDALLAPRAWYKRDRQW